jgi:hypothetical protein
VANTIKIKRSTGSAAPTNLAFGELAYSSGSGKLYFGSSTNGTTVNITEVGGAYYADLLTATPGTAAASKSLVVDASRNIGNLATVTATEFVGDLTGQVSDISNHDTDALAEGATNQYFTQARARGSVSASDPSGALTYDSATGVFSLDTGDIAADLTTDDIAEGSTNLYFTETRARDSISVTDAGGDGSLSYDNVTGVLTYTGPSASEVRAHFSAGTGVSITDGQVSIGQAVGTTDNVTFNNVTVDGTLSSDDITATNVTVTGNAVITGDLTVQGTTTTVNSTAVAISDINLTLAKDATTAAQANGAGLTVAGASATLTYASAGDKWVFNKQVEANVTGDLTGNADTATALETARDFSASGDATASAVSFDGTGNVDLVLTLANSGVTAGAYGSSSEIPVVTVDAKGRVTSVTTASITTSLDIAGDSGTDTVDLATETLTFAGSGAISAAVTANTVTVSVDVASDTVQGVASFASGNFAVTAGAVAIKAAGVDTAELAAAAVTEAKIAADAVTTAKIADGAVTNAKLANSSITLTGGSGSDAVALGESLAISGTGAISTAVTANEVTVSVAVATDTGTKGVASYNANHFDVVDGVVSIDPDLLDGGTY